MAKKDKTDYNSTIYVRSLKKRIEVDAATRADYIRYCDNCRHRMMGRGLCSCPPRDRDYCDGDCLTCKYRVFGNDVSLDEPVIDSDGDETERHEIIGKVMPDVGDLIEHKESLKLLIQRLGEEMPSGIEFCCLYLAGYSKGEIAEILKVPLSTLESRLNSAKKKLTKKYPKEYRY